MGPVRNILLFFTLLSVVSCIDGAWVGIVEDELEDDANAAPAPVVVGIGKTAIGKSSGAVDPEEDNGFSDANIYVYAFNKTTDAPFTSTSKDNPKGCIIDAMCDGDRTNAGRKAYINQAESFVSWPDAAEPVFYPTGVDAYDFYAYYVDDYVPTGIRRYSDRIVIPIVIDGSMDVMSGRAEYNPAAVNPIFSQAEKKLISERAFSAYAARRDIHPFLFFRHHLTRLRFELYPATEDSHTCYVNSLAVNSKADGMFTAVAKNIDNEGIDFSGSSSYSALPLCEKDGSPLQQMTYHPKEEADYTKPIYERPAVQVGGTLLVAPDDKYKVMMDFFEDKGQGYFTDYEFDITSKSGFKPGQQYVVRIAVYGKTQMEFSVDLEPWGTGGNIILDDEDKYTPEN